MTKTFIEILYPGSLFPESQIEEVKDRAQIPLPKGAFAYQFFDQQEVESDNEILRGKPKNYSGRFYEGTVYTKEEVIKEVGENSSIVFNIDWNNDKAIKTVLGNWQPFTPKDTLLSSKQ